MHITAVACLPLFKTDYLLCCSSQSSRCHGLCADREADKHFVGM